MAGPFDGIRVPGTAPAESAPTPSVFDGIRQPTDTLKPALELGIDANPDTAAQNKKIAKNVGLPVEAIEADQDAFHRLAKQADIATQTQDAPTARAFFSDPANVKLAHDSADQLVKAESVWGRRTGQPKPDNRWKSDGSRVEGNAARAVGAEIVDIPGMFMRGTSDLYGVATRNLLPLDQRSQQIVSSAVKRGIRAIGLTDFADALEQPAPWWVDPAQILKRPGEAIGVVAEDVRPPVEERNIVTEIAGGLGQVSAQIALALTTGGASSIVSLLSMAAMGADQQSKQMQAAGVEEGTPEADAAIASGAAITVLTERYGLGNLLEKIPAAVKSRIGRVLAGFGSEASQEIVEQVLQNLTALALYDPTQEIFEGVERSGEVGGIVGAIVAAIVPGRQAIQHRQMVEDARKVMQAAKLTERDPETAAIFHGQAMADNDVPEVYVPAAKLAPIIDAAENPVALAEALGVKDQMEEALALGGDVRIGAKEFSQHILLTDAYDQIADDVKLGPDAWSKNEADEFAKTGVKEEAQRLAAEVSRDTAPTEITPEMNQELQAAGFSEDEIKGMSPADAQELLGDTAKPPREIKSSEEGKQFLTENFSASKMTPEEDAALTRYATAAIDGNKQLDAAFWTADMKRVFEGIAQKYPAPEDIVVFRGSAKEEDINSRGEAGVFTPTSLDQGWAETMADARWANPALERIVIPKGTPIIPVIKGDLNETEILLPPGVKLENVRTVDVDEHPGVRGDRFEPMTLRDWAVPGVKKDSQAPASNPDVQLAEEQIGLQGLFRTAREAGMTDHQFQAYLLAVARARQRADNRQQLKLLRQEQRENSASYKAERANVEQEVRENTSQLPVYAALQAIGRDRLDRQATIDALGELTLREAGSSQVEGRGKTASELGPDLLDKLPDTKGRKIYAPAREKGVNPDLLAEQHGFADAVEMFQAMIAAAPFEEAVQAQTDLLMKERHGDLMQRGQAIKAAIESLHNDTQAQLLAFELNQLREAKKQGRVTPALVRAEAKARLTGYQLRDIKADKFIRQERAAGIEAGKAIRKGNRPAAAAAKFRQLINFQYVRESYAIQAAYTKQSRELKKFMRERKEWRQIDAKSITRIREMLDGYDLTKGNNPDGRNMTWGEFSQLYADVKAEEARGRAARHYVLRERRVTRDWLVAEMTEAAKKLPDLKRADMTRRQDKSFRTKIGNFAGRLIAESKKLELELQKMDNGVLGGIWHKAIFQPVADAQTAREDIRRQIILPVMKALEKLPKDTRAKFRQRIQTRLREHPMRRSEILMVALNMGNEGNLYKMMEGSKKEGLNWTLDDLTDAVSHLSKEEWAWVQSVWDTFDKMYPRVEAIYRDERGTSPEKVVPRSWSIPELKVTMKGGYMPMMYDPERRPPQGGKSALEMMEDESRGSVYSGMTKARTGYSAPVLLDISQLSRGLEQAAHFITHYEVVRDLRTLLATKEVNAAIKNKLGPEMVAEFDQWLETIATNNRDEDSAKAWGAVISYFRAALSTAVMGGSYTTLVSQELGLATSVDALGQKEGGKFSNKEGAKWMAVGLDAYASAPVESVKLVRQLSGEMRHRVENTNREVQHGIEALREPTGIPGLDQYRQIQSAALMMIGGVQFYGVDVPTWLGAYYKAQAEGKTQSDAIAYADAIVRTSQSSGQLKDLAHLQRKGGLWRAATMFSTYTILLYNRALQAGGNGRSIKNVPGAVARLGWLILIPALADSLLRGEGPGEDDEDPEAFYLLKTLTYTLSAIPIVGRGISSSIEGYNSSMLATDSIPTNTARGMKAAYKMMFSEDEMTEKDYAAIAAMVGYLGGIPGTSQVSRMIRALGEEDADFLDFLAGPQRKN